MDSIFMNDKMICIGAAEKVRVIIFLNWSLDVDNFQDWDFL